MFGVLVSVFSKISFWKTEMARSSRVQASKHRVAAAVKAGVDTLELGTAEPLVDTLRRFLVLRGLRPATPLFRPTAAEAPR